MNYDSFQNKLVSFLRRFSRGLQKKKKKEIGGRMYFNIFSEMKPTVFSY